ncbi:hypothetical protein F0L74_16635 [Chitinophaga agrisoli]|uniref:Uncharacterized protein n=1 Tax=Chitinophaga agrisoli TaxID=2607653 RepID=A0A5B2VQQ0_9BACT|nr:hypothetical protein [Chitinophaga agrisoli]KAA2241521.1 hypothetical protein F0L74_16635 [Chitinophaga agrisoli]
MEELRQKLKTILSEMNSLRTQSGKYHSLKILCEQMLSVINDMQRVATDEDERRRLVGVYSALSHTNGKEVEFVKYHEDEMRKKNAAQKRQTEYFAALDKAIGLIRMDIGILI